MNWNDPDDVRRYQREWRRRWALKYPEKVKAKNLRYKERHQAELRAKFGDDYIIKKGAPRRPIVDGKLRCARCKQWQLLDVFPGDNSRAAKKHSWCRQCITESAREYREKNRERVRERQAARTVVYRERRRLLEIVRKYGLTELEVRALRQSQGDKCASCKTSLAALPIGKGRGWCIDHDHRDGRVRAVVCQRCNTILGMALENPDILRAIANYAETYCTAVEQKLKPKAL